MFNNVASSIKTLAVVILAIFMCCGVYYSVIAFAGGFLGAFFIFVIWCLAALASSLLTYGFGELIVQSTKTADILAEMRNADKKHHTEICDHLKSIQEEK